MRCFSPPPHRNTDTCTHSWHTNLSIPSLCRLLFLLFVSIAATDAVCHLCYFRWYLLLIFKWKYIYILTEMCLVLEDATTT